MNKFITLLGLALVAAGIMADPALKVRFGVELIPGNSYFVELPIDKETAVDKGYTQFDRPTTDRSELTMWCLESDPTLCTLYDVNGKLGGLQIALNSSAFSDAVFDWTTQGYVPWTVTLNGVTTEFYVAYQYYMSEDYLALEATERLAAYNTSTLYQGGMVSVSSFNGELMDIPATQQGIYDVGFTKQNCVIGMGHHSYWNMSSTTECTADSIAINFPLTNNGELVGMGMNIFGKFSNPSGMTDHFEYPNSLAVKFIVNSGPQCLYNLADSPGIVTMHTYYVNHPYFIFC